MEMVQGDKDGFIESGARASSGADGADAWRWESCEDKLARAGEHGANNSDRKAKAEGCKEDAGLGSRWVSVFEGEI